MLLLERSRRMIELKFNEVTGAIEAWKDGVFLCNVEDMGDEIVDG